VWLARAPLLTFAGQWLVEDDPPQKADAILVLGGDEYGTRIVKAAQLQRSGYAPYVLVSGPPSLLGHESDQLIEFARRKGFAPSIFRPLNHDSDSTRSESAFLNRYLQSNGVRTLILVTSNFHTRRAARLMRKENPNRHVIVVAAPDPFFMPETWWKSRSGQKTFLFEWMKTVATSVGV
jgi:uncharacterized SAM-binding protein YcdF (DUF218 family)